MFLIALCTNFITNIQLTLTFLGKAYFYLLCHGFNAVQKRYLASCLRMRSTPEKHKIDSKHIRVEAMTEKVEVSFAEECKR